MHLFCVHLLHHHLFIPEENIIEESCDMFGLLQCSKILMRHMPGNILFEKRLGLPIKKIKQPFCSCIQKESNLVTAPQIMSHLTFQPALVRQHAAEPIDESLNQCLSLSPCTQQIGCFCAFQTCEAPPSGGIFNKPVAPGSFASAQVV